MSAGTATIPATTAEGVLLGARARAGARFYYFGDATLYLLVGDDSGRAGPSNYTVKLGARWLGQWDLPAGDPGPVRGVWDSPTGAAVVADFD